MQTPFEFMVGMHYFCAQQGNASITKPAAEDARVVSQWLQIVAAIPGCGQ